MSNINEIGGSIQDFLGQVRTAFEAQFPPKKQTNGMLTNCTWVRDIFEDYVIVNDEESGQLFQVNMTKTPTGIVFDVRPQWQKVKLTYTNEMVSDTVVTEFRGAPPEIPLRAGVNMEMLTEGDIDPFFISVEISAEGRISKNGLLHDVELANTLVEQINSQASEGIMGHIKEGERSTAFPVSDVHWLGAARQGKTTWAKGYIPKTAIAQREHFRILKATNGRAATSITGPAIKEFVDKNKGTWKATNFQLEQLDLAPFTRAALPPESSFVITREMEAPDQGKDNNDMDKSQVLAELTVDDIPAALREKIVREVTATIPNNEERVQELERNLQERDTKLSALEIAVAEFSAREYDRTIDSKVSELTDWKINTADGKQKLDSFRKALRGQIVSAVGNERDSNKMAKAIDIVWSDMKPIAETVRDALAGPPAIVSNRTRDSRKIEDTPEARQKARSTFSF